MEWRPEIGSNPVITLTTDFGVDDPYVGMMKAVILSIAPEVRIVDLTHGIGSHDVMEAALVIASGYAYFPKGAIHVVVVDPGVGSSRRPLLVVTEEGYFVAPDNGVLSRIYAGSSRVACLELTATRFFHHPVSQTFHGRDVFAPVAAWLSRGVEPVQFGSPDQEVGNPPLAGGAESGAEWPDGNDFACRQVRKPDHQSPDREISGPAAGGQIQPEHWPPSDPPALPVLPRGSRPGTLRDLGQSRPVGDFLQSGFRRQAPPGRRPR